MDKNHENLDLDSAQVLLSVAMQFGSLLDLDTLLPFVVRQVADLANAQRALFALFDECGRIRRAVMHNLEWEGGDHPLPVSQSILTTLLKERRPVFKDYQFNDPRSTDSIRSLSLCLVGGVPVEIKDQVVGVIYVDSRAQAFPELHRKTGILIALSRLVATALENAQLFEEQRFRTHLLAQMAHDFRTPLAVIGTHAWRLQQLGIGKPDLDKVIKAGATIDASAKRMVRMIDSTLELARIDAAAAAPPVEELDVADALRARVSDLEVVAERRDVTFCVEAEADLPRARTIADWLAIVLDNLLFNAFKHALNGSPITVHVARRSDAGPQAARDRPIDDTANLFRQVRPLQPDAQSEFLEIAVHNLGRPIAPDDLETVFRAWRRGARQGDYSAGLGLAIVDQCTRHLGGLCWAESSTETGTCFRFTLPTQLAPTP